MLKRFFPEAIDNRYAGQFLALGLLAALLLIRGVIAFNCIINGHQVASGADGIPIDSFTAAGAQTVISDFAVWGVAQLVLCAVGVLALVRYRAMVPLIFAVLLVEHLARRLVLIALPVVTSGHATASFIAPLLFTLEIGGLILSLWPRRASRRRA